jgi:hypothetical protein
VHLGLRISPRNFEKIRNGHNGILRGWGKLIHVKKTRSRKSRGTVPFNFTRISNTDFNNLATYTHPEATSLEIQPRCVNSRSFVMRLTLQVGLFYAVYFFLPYVSGDKEMLLGSRKLSRIHWSSPEIAHNQDRENNPAQFYMFIISYDRTSAQPQLKLSCLLA